MDNLVEGNWRAVALSSSVPCVVMLLGNIFLLDESPRFLLVQNKVQEAIEILNKIGANNVNNFQELTSHEVDLLKKWKKELFRVKDMPLMERLEGLFHSSRVAVTWRLLLVCVFLSFVGAGMYFLMPFILN